jgi:hypothetical protein
VKIIAIKSFKVQASKDYYKNFTSVINFTRCFFSSLKFLGSTRVGFSLV